MDRSIGRIGDPTVAVQIVLDGDFRIPMLVIADLIDLVPGTKQPVSLMLKVHRRFHFFVDEICRSGGPLRKC